MKILTFLSVIILTSVTVNTAQAGTSEITWTEPKKYTDIRAGNEHNGKFKTRIFKAFEEHFAKLSEQLPEGQVLKVDVTNLDLAGDVRFNTSDRIRVITSLYIPRIEFSYEVINSDQTIAQTGAVNLKDMGFLISSVGRYNNRTIPYEKAMLDRWFRKTFAANS